MSDDRKRLFATEYDSFEEAFPNVTELKLRVEETDMVETQRTMTYDEESLSSGELRCSNHPYKNGGVYVDTILSRMIENEETELETTEQCKGHESMGRDQSRDCVHMFHLEIEIGYEK